MSMQSVAGTFMQDQIEASDDDITQAGVCANCAAKENCGFLASAHAPIQYCEMHECCAADKPRAVGSSEMLTETDNDATTVHMLGLCANCEDRSTCKLPKPISGVWHCEEYR